MHLPLTLTAAAAATLRDSQLIQATIAEQGLTDPKSLPLLGVTVEGFQSLHPHLHTGTLVLSYHFDKDHTPEIAAGIDLQQAADHLLGSPGRTALQSRLRSSSIWLRRLGPTAEYLPGESTDRTHTHLARIPFHLQTSL